MTICAVSLCASASNHYVSATTGDDANAGSSWQTAKATIAAGYSGCSVGDTLFIAAGTYSEMISVKSGVTILGGYNATTGLRDIDLYPTILDGTNVGKFLIVKYDNDCADPTWIEGLVLQNANHENEGGGAFIRGNMTLNKCTIRNCHGSNGGGAYVRSKTAGTPACITNCVIELCSSTSSGGGAYLYENAVMEGCIIRGCSGKYGSVRSHKPGCIMRNCVLYNNSCTVSGWPDSGGIFNEAGAEVYNCTSCNNYGPQYAGVHSDGSVFNSVFWGNRADEGFSQPANFISGAGGTASNNWADQGFNGESFATITMSTNNMDATGPHFNNPTNFVGAPTNAGEIAAMQAADWSLLSTSPLINQGRADKAPATDLLGVIRPVGEGVDVGAYEYDPNAAQVAVTSVQIMEDTVLIIVGEIGSVTPIIMPGNASNKRLTWTTDDPAVASVDANGGILGVTIDTTIVRVTTVDGGFTASAVVVVIPVPPTKYPDEVLAADSLYKIENYTIPSFIPFWVAKEAARIDSLNPESDLPSIAGKIADMNAAAAKLVAKEEPYNMVANINGDPKTRMAFAWFTNEGIEQGRVELLPMANATAADFASVDGVITVNATSVTTKALNYAVSQSGIIKATKMDPKTAFKYVSHKALAENLTPGTTYSWRVGYEGHWSDIAQFCTKDEEQGEYSFIYMSDSHIMDAEYVENAKWCATAAANTAPDARFCLFPGDFVETGTKSNSEWEWERWFEESIKPVIMKMPIVPTDGNHDDSENLNYDYHFNTPTDFAMSVPASYRPQFHGITYSFVYGDVLFLVYSLQDWWRSSSGETSMLSTYLSRDVPNWFKQEIAKYPKTKYRVTLAHKNVFSGSGHSTDNEIPLFRKFMLPIMKECEIDLAIQGHDHCYEVIGPVDPDTRTVIAGSVSNVKDTTINTNTNMNGKWGGEFTTDDGTMYFIGATCGRKRYYPYDRAKMESLYTTDPALLFDGNHHDVENYFDLFTSRFGQPGAPSFTKFTVKENGIEVNSYVADQNGNATLFNKMQITRTKEHTVPQGFENVNTEVREGEKFIRNGQLFIRKNGKIYTTLGTEVK